MKKRIRIGIEVQRIFREKKHGMEVVALELIREIQKLDHQNEYIIYAKNDGGDNCVEETGNFRIHTLPSRPYPFWEQFTLPNAVRADKLDFLHSTCNTSAINLRVPLVLTLHDIIYLENTDFKGTAYQNFGNLYRKMVVPQIVAKSQVIITVSNFERQVIIDKLKLPEGKVKVIYNGVSEKFNTVYAHSRLMAFQQQYNLPAKFILFLGNTAPKKNTTNVIKAYVEYRLLYENGLPLVILDYDRRLVLDYLKKIGKEELSVNFIFPGYVPPEEMPLLYNVSTLFLYPSLRESFGLPILEAMACGVPVITSNTSSMPEVAGDSALFVNPFDFHDIKDKIIQLLQDEILQSKMKQAGLKRAAEFTWKASAEQLLSVYSSVVF